MCNHLLCPICVQNRIDENILPLDRICCETDYERQPLDYPNSASFSIDKTCNLHCRFCRNEVIAADKEELAMQDSAVDRIISELIPHLDTIRLAGAGEIFASKAHKRLLFEGHTNGRGPKRLYIITNGTLFCRKYFEEIEKLYNYIELQVSINAATEGTYSKIMRGANFKRLCENLSYAGQLRKDGRLKKFKASFICMTDNVSEIHKFVEWMKAVNVDEIFFVNLFYRKGSFTRAQYEEWSLFDRDNQLKEEFRDVFLDPILNDPIVYGRNLFVKETLSKNEL
jgi:MoaA/NifB/PqqE/SkfB family radical SAM enzyme